MKGKEQPSFTDWSFDRGLVFLHHATFIVHFQSSHGCSSFFSELLPIFPLFNTLTNHLKTSHAYIVPTNSLNQCYRSSSMNGLNLPPTALQRGQHAPRSGPIPISTSTHSRQIPHIHSAPVVVQGNVGEADIVDESMNACERCGSLSMSHVVMMTDQMLQCGNSNLMSVVDDVVVEAAV